MNTMPKARHNSKLKTHNSKLILCVLVFLSHLINICDNPCNLWTKNLFRKTNPMSILTPVSFIREIRRSYNPDERSTMSYLCLISVLSVPIV